MDLLSNIAITLLGAIAGTVLPLALPYVVRRKRHIAREDLLGLWISSYQYYYQPETADQWIDEKVTIDIHGSQFRLRNSDNPLGDVYEGFASLQEGELIGWWRSTRRHGGHAHGSLLLTVLPMGGLLYGFFTAPRDTGERVFAAWVLGKTLEDVAKGKALIAKQTLRQRND